MLLSVFAQNSENMSLLGSLEYNQELNDIWGYVADKEYALVGVYNGFSMVDISDASNPSEVFFVEGPNSIWRDIKVWSNYAYITNESSQGLLIVDLSDLTGNTFVYRDSLFSSAHNIYIDENGYAYIFGADVGNGGCVILDVHSNPMNPVHLGTFSDFYFHDGMVRGDTLWGSAVYEGNFYAIDVSDKSNPIIMNGGQAFQSTPHTFTHNCWISDDGSTLFTTDEVSGAFLTAYDVSDLDNIYELDRIQSNPGSGVIPHNTHVLGNYLVTSYYKDGIVVHDATYPNNLIEVAHYDAYQGSGNGFDGSWGAYPYLPSGNILSSEINSGADGQGLLLVLRPEYQQACYLQGQVIDQFGTPLNNVSIEILQEDYQTTTNLLGNYVGGLVVGETYLIEFSLSGFTPQILEVSLINGELTTLDVVLNCAAGVNVEGVVSDAKGLPITGASVLIQNEMREYNTETNMDGVYSLQCVELGSYDVSVGSWGYITQCVTEVVQGDASFEHSLAEGYYDDFTFDFGWTFDGNASSGFWERGVPNETVYQDQAMAPGSDVLTDCLEKAYVTGNGIGGVGNNDVDDGEVVLQAPEMDLSMYQYPELSYVRWFANAGGNGTPNDYFSVRAEQGETIHLELIENTTDLFGEWISVSIPLSQLDLSEPFDLQIVASDNSPGHLLEAAFDQFQIIEGEPYLSIEEKEMQFEVYPNPSKTSFTIQAKSNISLVNIYSLQGQLLYANYPNSKRYVCHENFAPGVYTVECFDSKTNNKSRVKMIRLE